MPDTSGRTPSPSRADVYREVAALVNDLPRDWTPQRVAEVIAESADQLTAPASWADRPSDDSAHTEPGGAE